MFRSLHMKLMLILLLLITSLMAVVGAFLTISISSFYIDSFYQQMAEAFGQENLDFVNSLRAEAEQGSNVSQIQSILEAQAGLLGIDSRTRHYYILDGMGNYLAGSDNEGGRSLEVSPNLLAAENGRVGDSSDFTSDYMDVAIPFPDESGQTPTYIIYIRDSKATVSDLTAKLITIIMQAMIIGLLISLLLSFLLSKAMVGPIEKLTAGAERVAAGDFGEKLPVESSDEIGVLTGTFNEMADVLQSSLAAMENERNKLDTLFLHMSDGVVAFDAEGKLIHCNPAATEMLQRSIGPECSYDELFGSVQPFGEMLALQRPNFAQGEMKVGERTLDLSLAPFSNQAAAGIGGVLVVIHDITEQHRNEERRKEFVANVSHELRTPLTNVRSYAETLRDSGGDIPRQTEDQFLGIIINETDRMTHIVQDLLTLSRLDSGNAELNLTRFQFSQAIDSVYQANALEARRRGHQLSYTPVHLPLVTGDRARLEQVMMNVVSNAIKYTPDGGHISITAGTDGDSVWMEVADDGIGIPAKDQDRIFDRFYRVDKARSRESGGTGLGLSIAKEIMDRHHGSIRLVPHEGPGTTVRITLPIVPPQN